MVKAKPSAKAKPLHIGIYGTDVRPSENLYFYLDDKYFNHVFDASEWNKVKLSSNIYENILYLLDIFEITSPDIPASSFSPKNRETKLYQRLKNMYKNTEEYEKLAILEKNPSLSEENISDLFRFLVNIWMFVYNDDTNSWNIDNIAKYLLFPQKIGFLFKKCENEYYWLFPKKIEKKYNHLILSKPDSMVEVYEKNLTKEVKLWKNIIRNFCMSFPTSKEWNFFKVPTNSIMDCIIVYLQHLEKNLMAMPSSDLSTKDKKQHYRNVISYVYRLSDDYVNAQRVEDSTSILTNKDIQILMSRLQLWNFTFKNTHYTPTLSLAKQHSYWNYFQRNNYNYFPEGILFLMENKKNEYILSFT